MSGFEFPSFYEEQRRRVDEGLERWLPPSKEQPTRLHEAMRYSVFSGGKRLRGVLVLEAGRLGTSSPAEALEALAACVEMVHTYSLIHDDLPAMDDDDYRRGEPSCHRKFGEDVAILAGDALLTRAFEVLARLTSLGVSAERSGRIIRLAGQRCGSKGLIGGQILDLRGEDGGDAMQQLERIHRLKTGALMTLSLEVGGLAASVEERTLEGLARYGESIGLAFQIKDDLLDVTGEFQKIGKDVQSDTRAQKLTYPRLLGVEESEQRAHQYVQRAEEALKKIPDPADRLLKLARVVLRRDH